MLAVSRIGRSIHQLQLFKQGCRFQQVGSKRSASSTPSLDLSGMYPPIATPFNADESIAWDKLQDNMSKWNAIDFKGYVVQGSNGEYAYLEPAERVEMVRRVSALAKPGAVIMAGAGCESTRATILMTSAMAEAGAHCALVVTPCYYKASMSSRVLREHYTKVADASPIPIVLYSVPPNTGIDLAPDVIIPLSSHPNIIGLKDSGGDISKLGNLVFKTSGNDFQILAGSAGFLLPALTMGCVGGVCALANCLGEECVTVMALHASGHLQEAKLLQQRLVAPNAAVTKGFGVPGLKVAMEWCGFYGGPVRAPLLPLPEADRDTIKNIFCLFAILTFTHL